jgi:uncharacterized protein YraI
MRNRLWFAGLTSAAALLACNISAPPPSAPTTHLPINTGAQPSSTVPPPTLPFDLPTFTPTSTPTLASLHPKDAPVNCRFGPDTVYILVGELKSGQSAQISGKDPQGTWYYVEDPGNPGGNCWVSADFVEVTGNVDSLPVVPPPIPSVIEIGVSVNPARVVVPCSQFPQVIYVNADITTNGPTLVTYRWEVSTGVSSVNNTIAFEGASTQTISDFYKIASPNDYWIIMHVLSPNDISEKSDFQVNCNP